MQCVEQLSKIESASYVVPCNGVREHAYVVSLEKKQFWKRSWMKETAEEDADKIDNVNSQLPDCPELTEYITGKFKRKMSEYYLGSKIIGFEDEVILDIPDAIFLQRVSARTKTFDMVLFYETTPKVINIVDKEDLDTIRNWYPHKIYSCGADPLPLGTMRKWMEDNKSDTMYDDIYDMLFNKEESSCSEFEPESEPESEDESCAESEEDEIEACTETESEESDQDDEYIPEPPAKKIKV